MLSKLVRYFYPFKNGERLSKGTHAKEHVLKSRELFPHIYEIHRSCGIIGLLALGVSLLTGCPGSVPPDLKGIGAGVHGSVYVGLPSKGDDVALAQGEGTKVYLPDFELFLKNLDTGKEGTPQITDLYGRFIFPKQKPGTYQLRWKQQAGWAKGQYPDKIIIRSNTQYPGLLLSVAVIAQKRTGVLVGRVKLGDGGSPWFYEEFFGINKTATITVVDNTGKSVTKPVRANTVGKFAVAGLPKGNLRVRATSEADVTEQLVPATAVSFGGPVLPINLTFKNRRPQIQGFVAKRNAAPGETIKCSVRAHDYDRDPLKFEWRNPAGTGNLTPAGGSVDWELPKEPGQYTIYVVTSDGKGGYATGRLTVQVGATDEVFSGRVVDQNGVPVTGATVAINSTIASSGAQGAFLLRTPLSDLYVMNISKPGFALFSRRFDRGKIGQVWRLVRAQVTTVDPSKPIDLVDSRPELEKKQQKGVRIRIPADSLVDATGNKPSGLISAAVATLDIANGEAPGDWGAIERGREVNLISYGAVFVEFSDSSGKKYNLAADKTAEVALPAPLSLLAKAPESTSFWSYDEKDGLWKPLVGAKLDKNTGSYIGEVKHLSTINTDLSKNEASCLKVILDSTIPTGLKLRITDVPGGTDFGQSFEFVMDATVNAVYRLPPNTNVKLDVLNLNSTVIENLVVEETGVALPGNIVNSGGPIPPGVTLWPNVDSPEIDNCKAVTLKLVIPKWNGIYVWTDETSTDEDRRNLINVCTDPSHPLDMVLLSSRDPENQVMWPAANLRAFNSLAHQEGLLVYALFDNKNWIGEVNQYNTDHDTAPSERFDGYAMDYEVEPSTPSDIQYYADAKEVSGTLPLHVSIGWHWDNYIMYNGRVKPAFQHIFDIVDSVDVQTTFDTNREIECRAECEVSYATLLNYVTSPNKPVFLTIETKDLSRDRGWMIEIFEGNTFYGEGEAVMWNELYGIDGVGGVNFGASMFTGFILHYYKGAYSIGTSLWPSHAVR